MTNVSVTVVEKDKQVGGLAKTIDWDGWKFDLGLHNFHSIRDEIIGFYQDFINGEFIERRPLVRLYIFNKLFSYPLVGADVLFAMVPPEHSSLTFEFPCNERDDDPMVCPKFGRTMKIIVFITDFGAVDRIIDHLKLTFIAEKPPPSCVTEQDVLMGDFMRRGKSIVFWGTQRLQGRSFGWIFGSGQFS